MRPIAVVIPTIDEAVGQAIDQQVQATAGVETTIIISLDPARSGFTGTANRGLKRIPDGHDVLLLNDDNAGLYPGWLRQLQEAMYSREDIGIIGPSGNCETAPMKQWDKADGHGLLSVQWFPFFCVLIRRECFDQVGLLDERFIHYSSDYEYCDRARLAGWHVVWCRDVTLDHQMHGSGEHQAWAGHDLSLYQLHLHRMQKAGQWQPVRALPS